MELEFDKEMDAILRRGRGDLGASAATTGTHLDADMIATFVDNALPQSAKLSYTEHLADCGRCRKFLSQAVLLNETAASTAAVGAAGSLGAASVAESWWSRLFRTPNLAMALGALVLAFSGVLGYIALRNRGAANSTVSQVTDQDKRSGPYASEPNAPLAAANTASNSNAIPQTGAPANAVVTNSSSNAASGPSASGEPVLSGRISGSDQPTAGMPPVADEKFGDVRAEAPPAPLAAAKPESVVTENDKAKVDSTATREAKPSADEDLRLAKKTATDDSGGNRRDFPAPAAKSGPSRSSGNAQQQMQSNVLLDGAETRSVAGRSFSKRKGVWYDVAYRGQGTREIKRGSDKYVKLDAGLRNTADSLGGTVVIVWGSKAYKIY